MKRLRGAWLVLIGRAYASEYTDAWEVIKVWEAESLAALNTGDGESWYLFRSDNAYDLGEHSSDA